MRMKPIKGRAKRAIIKSSRGKRDIRYSAISALKSANNMEKSNYYLNLSMD